MILMSHSKINDSHWIDYRPGRYYYWNKGLLLCWFKTRFIVGIQRMREMAKKDPWKSFFFTSFFCCGNKKNQLFLFATNQWVRCWLVKKQGMLRSKMPAPVPQLLISTQLLTDSRGDTACCCLLPPIILSSISILFGFLWWWSHWMWRQ